MVSGGWGRGVVAAPLLFAFRPAHVSISTPTGYGPLRPASPWLPTTYVLKKNLKKNLTRQSKRCILVLL